MDSAQINSSILGMGYFFLHPRFFPAPSWIVKEMQIMYSLDR